MFVPSIAVCGGFGCSNLDRHRGGREETVRLLCIREILAISPKEDVRSISPPCVPGLGTRKRSSCAAARVASEGGNLEGTAILSGLRRGFFHAFAFHQLSDGSLANSCNFTAQR